MDLLRRLRATAIGIVTLVIAATLLAAPTASAASATAPAAPTDLRIFQAGRYNPDYVFAWVNASWRGTAADDGHDIEFRYRVIVDGVPGPEWVERQQYDHESGQIALSRAVEHVPSAANVLTVTATTAAGTSEAARLVLPRPVNLRVISQDGDEVTIAWDYPADVIAGKFWIFDGDELLTIANVSQRQATVKRLAPGRAHRLTVQSLLGSSDPVVVTTAPSADTVAPSTPLLGAHLFDWGYCFWNLSWAQSTDNVTAQPQIGYDLLEFDISTGQNYVLDYDVAVGAGAGRSSFTSVPVRVRAADQAGNVSGLSALTSSWS